jgi:hypothetical protein
MIELPGAFFGASILILVRPELFFGQCFSVECYMKLFLQAVYMMYIFTLGGRAIRCVWAIISGLQQAAPFIVLSTPEFRNTNGMVQKTVT